MREYGPRKLAFGSSPALDQNSSSGEPTARSDEGDEVPPGARSTERRGRWRAELRTTGFRACLACGGGGRGREEGGGKGRAGR